jgi:parallel beta-helix repeat protein
MENFKFNCKAYMFKGEGMKRSVSGIMLMLLLMAMFSLAFNIKPTKAGWTGTVYIRADGSIDPPDAPITTYDNITYTVTDNITSTADGIIVERDNIIIDGAGYTLQGKRQDFYKGIDLTNRRNVTIKNIRITAFYYGIKLFGSSNNNIIGNNITNNGDGIDLFSSWNNSIIGNNIANNSGGGICLEYFSNNNIITGNNMTANKWDGIRLEYSSNNSIVGNTFINDGLTVWKSYHNFVKDNTVNGKPLVYLEGEADHSISDAGQVILVSCNRIRVENLNLSKTSVGMQLLKTNDSIITGNNITANNRHGIYLEYSSNNSITGNNIANSWEGIRLYDSSNNSITGNNITNNWGGGIRLEYSSNNSIITGNNITNNYNGICLEYSSNSIITGNNITANRRYGIYLYYSSNNSIFHNNFVDNAREAYSYNSVNVWDDGYPSGGNYWSDYTGVDLYSGPYQNETGSDGIGDTPYFIDAYNVDKYPLMSPLPLKIFDVVCEGTHYSVSVQSNSTVTHFIFNQALAQISFNVSGISGAWGFCNITIPKALMTGPWTYTFQGDVTNIDAYEKDNETHTFINLQYKHASTFQVIIKASWVIPEYPSTTILTIFMLTTTVLAVLTRSRRLKHRFNNR